MVGTPAAADAIDPRNCPRCDHSFGIALAGAYRLTERFRGTDSPVWVEPVQVVAPVAPTVETVAVPSADEVADGEDFAEWLESAADRVRTRLNGTLSNALVRIPHEPGETVDAGPDYGYADGTGDAGDTGLPALTETLSPAERHELDAFLADAFADRSAMCAEVFDAEALPETRDDGALYHGRVPSQDDDELAFSPYVIAQAGKRQMVPPCAADVSTIPAWAYETARVA